MDIGEEVTNKEEEETMGDFDQLTFDTDLTCDSVYRPEIIVSSSLPINIHYIGYSMLCILPRPVLSPNDKLIMEWGSLRDFSTGQGGG